MTDEERLAAEQRARVLIDRQLTDAGWVVQDRRALNLFAGQGVAVREVVMAKGHGRADYLIYVDQKAVGVIEAKPAGTTLSGVEWQSSLYAEGLRPAVLPRRRLREGPTSDPAERQHQLTRSFMPARLLLPIPRPPAGEVVLRT